MTKRIKTREHRVLFLSTLFKQKVVESKLSYKRHDKHKGRKYE